MSKTAAPALKTQAEKPPADPARSLGLLWGSHRRPGRSGLTIRAIVDAALQVADTEGLDALSMRRVADAVKVGTMTLYSYVPGKDDLTDLMADTVMGTVYADVDEPRRQGDWRAALRFVAEKNWALHLAHPWLCQLNRPRPVLGPHFILKYEAELRPIDGIGLRDVEMDALLSAVLTHVGGAARVYHGLRAEAQASAQTDQEWWLTQAPTLDRLLDVRRFPTAARVGQSVGDEVQAAADPEHTLRFGLERLLDGVEALLAGRTG
ncbi:TetR/AcrR family transcriptional regulator [Deinococcus sp.]|uniref:TetR/AcrR family transcriptional regulator n=1 Tax=Deinococcus sp. TaxID=47478 RepID=UPI002869C442|nr:TetR/AcrR family transcriptional regulator [Deinococcus sp.]